ncbi:MAG: hypothetical protein KAV82_09880 [Phycisphaerae bacterium]|nr:hypothetical protein [Phycisphaerae bacterium]
MGGNLAEVRADEVRKYGTRVVLSRLGSVTTLANSNGTVVERYVYDPYGKTMEDEAHFNACYGSSDPLCVFVHDRNGVSPEPECARWSSIYFDADGDARLDVAQVHYVPAKDERVIRYSTRSSS